MPMLPKSMNPSMNCSPIPVVSGMQIMDSSEPLGLATSYIKTLELDLTQIEHIVSEQLTEVEVAQQLHFTRLRGKRPFTNPFPAIAERLFHENLPVHYSWRFQSTQSACR